MGSDVRLSFTSISTFGLIAVLLLFVMAGVIVTQMQSVRSGSSVEDANYRFMWLDFWNLLFVGTIAVVWQWRASSTLKRFIYLSVIATYGALALSIVFGSTPFPDNAFWGDQKFRMAIVERFTTTWWLSDYYYRGLPIFYPPVYYYALALVARLIGDHGYEMLQIGLKILFVCMPFLLYSLWRKVVTPTAAVTITAAVMLVDVGGSLMLVAVPHAFIANSLFVPWWLHYIQGIGARSTSRSREWVSGGIVGALLLATYFYPFILLGMLLLAMSLVRLVAWVGQRRFRLPLKRAWLQVLGVGIFSLPYWLPNLLVVLQLGMDRTRGDWYHSGSGGFGFPFLEFNWVGVLGFLAIVYTLFRARGKVARSLASLLAACLGLFLLGSALGALDISLNLTKDREFAWAIMSVCIGLGLIGGARWLRRHRRGGLVSLGSALLLLVLATRGMTAFAHDGYVERARNAVVPDFGLSAETARKLEGHVILPDNEEIYAFIPAYAFVNINEHFAHPASRFALRYDFLAHLTHLRDPRLLAVALRHNSFDGIDYLMPERKGDSQHVYVSLSNYPNGLVLRDLALPAVLLEDSSCFHRMPEGNLYQIRDCLHSLPPAGDNSDRPLELPSEFSHVVAIADRLDSSGQEYFSRAYPELMSHRNRCLDVTRPFRLDRSLVLIDCQGIAVGDSTYLTATVRVNRPVKKPGRFYLHIYPDRLRGQMLNFDFSPEFTSDSKMVGDLITLSRAIPTTERAFGFVLGLFDDHGPRGASFSGHIGPYTP